MTARSATAAAKAGRASATASKSKRSDGSTTWLLLIYRVPSEPTRLRAGVWRKLRNYGAIYIQSAAAAIPYSSHNERMMRALRNEIVETMAGKAFLVASDSVLGEADLVALYNAARDDEYEEILDKCVDFHAGVDKEIAAEHFTYGELEENEEDLTKLRGWYDKVKARDVLGAGKQAAVIDALNVCSRKLEDFAAKVFASQDEAL